MGEGGDRRKRSADEGSKTSLYEQGDLFAKMRKGR